MKDNRQRSRGSGSGSSGKDKIDALGRLLYAVYKCWSFHWTLNLFSIHFSLVKDSYWLRVKE